MHDSLTALGGMIPLINMQLGEIIFGGVGSGLYGMLIVRHHRDLRRRPDGRAHAGVPRQEDRVQGGEDGDARRPLPAAGDARRHRRGARRALGGVGDGQPGPHGFSEVLYAFTSAAANNGSAFAGLSANTMFYNVTLGVGMLVGRFFVIVPALAIAGSLAAKKTVPASAGTFPTTGRCSSACSSA